MDTRRILWWVISTEGTGGLSLTSPVTESDAAFAMADVLARHPWYVSAKVYCGADADYRRAQRYAAHENARCAQAPGHAPKDQPMGNCEDGLNDRRMAEVLTAMRGAAEIGAFYVHTLPRKEVSE